MSTSRTVHDSTEESGNIYKIIKIYKEDPTPATFTVKEDRYRIVVDKNLPFPGETLSSSIASMVLKNVTKVGAVNLFKFSPATTGNYDFVTSCSNRGTCDEGLCESSRDTPTTTATPRAPWLSKKFKAPACWSPFHSSPVLSALVPHVFCVLGFGLWCL